MTPLSIITIMITHFVALIVPGPDVFLILRTSLAHGFRQSVFTCLGVGTGIILWIVLTAFGLKTLFALFPSLRLILMAFSVCYLLYLSFALFASARRGGEIKIGTNTEKSASAWQFFVVGFLTNLSNPKAVLYFASIFSNFVDGAAQATQVALLVAIVSVESVVCFTLLGKLFSARYAREIFLRNQRILDAVCSVIFAIFAGIILLELISELAS